MIGGTQGWMGEAGSEGLLAAELPRAGCESFFRFPISLTRVSRLIFRVYTSAAFRRLLPFSSPTILPFPSCISFLLLPPSTLSPLSSRRVIRLT